MSALREDGTKTFYQVELLSTWRDNEWVLCQEPRKDWKEKYSFSSNGDCWQETGHHGTYDKDWAFIAMLEHAKEEDNKGNVFRLVKRTITLETEQVGQVCVQKENV
jgi:hypothetical protein